MQAIIIIHVTKDRKYLSQSMYRKTCKYKKPKHKLKISIYLSIYLSPTPPHQHDATQGQFFKRDLTGLNSAFLSPRLPDDLSIIGEIRLGSIRAKIFKKSYMIVSEVKLATVIEGDSIALFSIALTPKCRGERYSFPWIPPLYPWSVPYNAEC